MNYKQIHTCTYHLTVYLCDPNELKVENKTKGKLSYKPFILFLTFIIALSLGMKSTVFWANYDFIRVGYKSPSLAEPELPSQEFYLRPFEIISGYIEQNIFP